MKLLIAYGTSYGQTAKIAAKMAERARAAGHTVELCDLTAGRTADAGTFDAILVGGSVQGRGYKRAVGGFIRRELATLRSRPSAFFSVCMAIASKNPDDRAQAEKIARDFPVSLGWPAQHVAVFAGGVPFTRYGFFIKLVMRSITRKELGAVDTRRDYEFTDWSQVANFIDGFLQRAQPRLPQPPRPTFPQPTASA